MLKSMTGFGRGEFHDDSYRFIVEIKAVNHRYNEIVIRMPKNLNSIEDRIRRSIANSLSRGRIDVYITMEEYSRKNRIIRVDKELAMAYHNALKELADLFSVTHSDNIYHISKYPDVINVDDVLEDVNALWPKLSQAIDIALKNLLQMRLTEGTNIANDLLMRVDKLSSYINEVEQQAPQTMADYRDKLISRMRELLATIGAEPDETRLLQEIAIYADKTSITEELVRLRSHLTQLRSTLQSNEAIGRKLDFIIQEVNRETNTIASKANDYAITNIMVEIKSEIEKIREQIQNIE